MVPEFGNAAFEDRRIEGVDQRELVRVHGDSHSMRTDEFPNFLEEMGKMILPFEFVYRMRGKRH